MNLNGAEGEKFFTSALINALALLPVPPTREEVTTKAAALATVFQYSGDLSLAIEEAMIAVDMRMGAGVSLVDVAAYDDTTFLRCTANGALAA